MGKTVTCADNEYLSEVYDVDSDGLHDTVCVFSDAGGDVLMCEGKCKRCFHPTIQTGLHSFCKSFGFTRAEEYHSLTTFLCSNCKHDIHHCFICGLLGSSDKASNPEANRLCVPSIIATVVKVWKIQMILPYNLQSASAAQRPAIESAYQGQ